MTVKPVIDLAEHIATTAYEIPDRLTEQTDLRDHTCVFPWCTRPARRCDHDHVIPHDRPPRAGPTCSCNIAALCRRHHRLKTHTTWTYTVLEPGTYLWSSPHGYHYLRDHEGTLDVSTDPPAPSASLRRTPPTTQGQRHALPASNDDPPASPERDAGRSGWVRPRSRAR